VTPYLLVDGAKVTAEIIEKRWLGFRLRLPAREIRLISGAGSPAELKGVRDTRPLGVLLRKLCWEQNGSEILVPVDSPGFMDGFHAVEVHDAKDGPVRWTTGNAALPPDLFPPWQGDVLLHVSCSEWKGSAQQPETSDEWKLLSAFESLGEDCEFGLMQRRYLVEPPLSLFRWGGAPVKSLIQGLDSGFEGLAEPDSTELVWDGQEYFLRTPYVTMHTQCLVQQDEAGQAEVLRCGRATLRILRRKLLKDIADARRIFVFKSLNDDFGEVEMRRLHAALRRIGPACLLCAVVARPGQPVGHVERLTEGLYAGYLDRFVIPNGPFDKWLSICSETLASHGGL
jgi:hypothetical protein